MTVRAVFFDIGETLINESRLWMEWADWLGVSHLTMGALIGATIALNQHHHNALRLIRPDFDVEREEAAREAAGLPNTFDQRDLYTDVRPCLEALRRTGYFIGISGNQPARADNLIRALDLPFDVLGTSAAWGVEKPAPAFFQRMVEAAGVSPAEIAYVGDRLDNDILPAREAGLVTVFLRRGPWAYVHATRPEIAQAHVRIESLAELPEALAQYAKNT